MITAEELLKAFKPSIGYDKDIEEAIKEYAKEAIKADMINLIEHVKVKQKTFFSGMPPAWQIDKDSIINAPNIELL